jgi:diguanylate cyclase (GGDEF)-like protein
VVAVEPAARAHEAHLTRRHGSGVVTVQAWRRITRKKGKWCPGEDHGTAGGKAPVTDRRSEEVIAMPAPEAGTLARGEREPRARAAPRLAIAGVACVLVLLTGFALWAASSTDRVAQQAARLTELNDAYQRARFLIAVEESLERKYRLEPAQDVRVRFDQAAASLVAALQFVQQEDVDHDPDAIEALLARHGHYVDATHRLFAAVDAGARQQVLVIDAQTEPTFDSIETEVTRRADQERRDTLRSSASLRRQVVVATPMAFGAGLGLLGLFCTVLVAYHRRIERQASQNQHQALHDALTTLPNRTLLRDRTGRAIRQADRELTAAALLLLDLDRFKEVNDTLGHHYGDLLLVQVGERLRATLREIDTVARLGGDEFAILLPRIADADGAAAVAAKLQAALAESFLLEGLTLDVEASIGVALYPDHGRDSDELLQRADIAMYVAKANHAGYMVFDPEQDEHSPRRLTLLGELRRAIEHGQLILHYQPKVDAHSGRVLGVEALVRWQHPEHGLLPPSDFIPLAERTGLIGPLTHYVLDAALRQCRQWLQAGHELSVAVNISTRRLLDATFPDEVADLLATWQVRAGLLVVEITESTIMADPGRAQEVLRRLDEMGVHLSIDDFGTGYSSMAYLKSLPVHELKVDRSFVSHMTSNASDAVIVRSTVDLGRNLGLRVVAEGVEDALTWQELDALGCDAIQGYYVSRPVPADALISWLEHRDPGPVPPPAAPGSRPTSAHDTTTGAGTAPRPRRPDRVPATPPPLPLHRLRHASRAPRRRLAVSRPTGPVEWSTRRRWIDSRCDRGAAERGDSLINDSFRQRAST